MMPTQRKAIPTPPTTKELIRTPRKQFDVYISGPMTGYPDHNFEAFNQAETDLMSRGYSVFNPARNPLYEDTDTDIDDPWEYYMRIDIAAICRSGAVVLLDGWRASKGARLEYEVADQLGIPTLSYPSLSKTGYQRRIALTGLSRTGKDTVGQILVKERGFERVAIGDIIKRQVDPLVRQHLGFSAFTEDDAKKEQVRQVLVHWGYANWDNIFDEFFSDLPDLAVNTRLFRKVEARAWTRHGGEVWEVKRPGATPSEPKEQKELAAIHEAGLISHTINNDGSIADLRDKVLEAL